MHSYVWSSHRASFDDDFNSFPGIVCEGHAHRHGLIYVNKKGWGVKYKIKKPIYRNTLKTLQEEDILGKLTQKMRNKNWPFELKTLQLPWNWVTVTQKGMNKYHVKFERYRLNKIEEKNIQCTNCACFCRVNDDVTYTCTAHSLDAILACSVRSEIHQVHTLGLFGGHPRREARGFLVHVLPPVWNFRAFSLIPLFYGPLLFFCIVLLLFCHPFSAIGPFICPLSP